MVGFSHRDMGADLILNERGRQLSEEGYGPLHDQGQQLRLAIAGDAYLQVAWAQMHPENLDHIREVNAAAAKVPPFWPWEPEAWKPAPDPKRNLIKAGALIAAAIDALEAFNDESVLRELMAQADEIEHDPTYPHLDPAFRGPTDPSLDELQARKG